MDGYGDVQANSNREKATSPYLSYPNSFNVALSSSTTTYLFKFAC